MKHKFPIIFAFLAIFLTSSLAADSHRGFLKCFWKESGSSISNVTYTPANSSFTSILRHTIQNLRLWSPSNPTPQVIITPEHESQVPPIVRCARKNGLQIRTRSGGHDYEGLSFIAQTPFVVLDLINLSQVTVDPVQKTAWVEAGANLGSLYYRIAEQSPVLGFPAGICPTVGVGGYFSGGGYGVMVRKFGIAADHVIDARMVDVNGRILDRQSMGEDLFWAIRGGGGASFGVILSWKVKLVDVPERVTVCLVNRFPEQNLTRLVQRYQSIAHSIDRDLFIQLSITRADFAAQSERNFTLRASFNMTFLGGADRLISIMQENFPELGLTREECDEMSWVESILYFRGFPIEPREILLNRTEPVLPYFKAKSDYAQRPIPEQGLEGLWTLLYEPEAARALIIFVPYGGIMNNISESALPFPHRAGNLYQIQYMAFWLADDAENPERYIRWTRRVYSYMAPYVSSSPRMAYLNYRDLDVGVNNNKGRVSYATASVWGNKYFGNNFDRLVWVKTTVDPQNYFRNEQSIPSLLEKNNAGVDLVRFSSIDLDVM